MYGVKLAGLGFDFFALSLFLGEADSDRRKTARQGRWVDGVVCFVCIVLLQQVHMGWMTWVFFFLIKGVMWRQTDRLLSLALFPMADDQVHSYHHLQRWLAIGIQAVLISAASRLLGFTHMRVVDRWNIHLMITLIAHQHQMVWVLFTAAGYHFGDCLFWSCQICSSSQASYRKAYI